MGRCRLLFGHLQAACTICGAHSISIPVPNHTPFILPIRFIHANKVQAAFEYTKSSLHIFNYLIYLNKISAKAHRARFRAAGLRTEAGKQFATNAVRVFRQIGCGYGACIPFGFIHQNV